MSPFWISLDLRMMEMAVTSVAVRRIKVKVHTLDVAPLRSESPPQKRSGMARVLKGIPHVHPQSE